MAKGIKDAPTHHFWKTLRQSGNVTVSRILHILSISSGSNRINKNLLVTAIATALMAPCIAAADVKIFGTIQAETGNVDIDIQGTGGDTSTTAMGRSASGAINGGGMNGLGFKGTEKLGNGLTAYFKINSEFSTFDIGTGGWNADDVFVGIKGDGWHAQFGSMNSLYKISSHTYDPFYGTGLQARATNAVSGLHNGYADNVGEIGFKSSGFSGGIQVTWEDSSNNSKVDSRASDAIDAGSWNGHVMYKANNWEASISYIDLDYGTANGDMNSWKVASRHNGNGWTLAAQYEQMHTDNQTTDVRRPNGSGGNSGMIGQAIVGFNPAGGAEYDSLSIFATHSISDSTRLMGRYSSVDMEEAAANGGNDVDSNHWALGVAHNLSRRTRIYGGYMDNNYDVTGNNDTDIDAWVLGMIHKF